MKIKKIIIAICYMLLGCLVHILTKSIIIDKNIIKLVSSFIVFVILMFQQYSGKSNFKYKSVLLFLSFFIIGYIVGYRF